MRSFQAAFLFAFVTLWFHSPASFAIQGGTEVDPRNALAATAVSLGDLSSGTLTRSFCSAVIASPHTVISAAHCLAGKDPTKIVVLFGFNGNVTTVMRLGTESHIPDQYKTYGDALPGARDNYDIGVLRFEGNLPNGFQPANLVATELTTADHNSQIWIGGFGLPKTGVLQACAVTLENSAFSNSEFELFASPGCTPAGGDSGGPDFRVNGNNIDLYGLHNWGWHDSAGKPNMSVEVKISYYKPWIDYLSR